MNGTPIGVRPLLLGVVGLALVAMVYLWPLAAPGVWIAKDSPFSLALAYAVDDNFKTGEGLWGWSEDDLGGFPLFSLFAPAPLGTLAMVGLHRLTGLPLPAVYKAIVALVVMLPAVSLWLALARRATPGVAAVVATGALLLTYHLVRPLGGEWAPYLGAGLLVAWLAVSDRWLSSERTWRRGAAVVALAAAVALSDVSAWIVLPAAVVAMACVFFRHATRATLGAWAAFSLLPLLTWTTLLLLLESGDWGLYRITQASPLTPLRRLPAWFLFAGSGEIVAHDLMPAFDAGHWADVVLAAGRVALSNVAELTLVACAVAGVIVAFRTRADAPNALSRWARVSVVLGALILVAVVFPRALAGPMGAWVAAPDRFVPYANVALLGLAAMSLAALRRRLPRVRWSVVAFAMLALAGTVRYTTYGEQVLLKTSARSVVWQELSDVWRYLRADGAASGDGVLYETLDGLGFLDGGSAAIAALSTHETGLLSMASWRLPAVGAVKIPTALASGHPLRPLAKVPDSMRRWQQRYVVVWWPGSADQLAAAGSLDVVHRSPNRLFTVLRSRSGNAGLATGGGRS